MKIKNHVAIDNSITALTYFAKILGQKLLYHLF